VKVNVIKSAKPTALQKLISELPFDPASEAEFKGLMFVEELLTLMKEQGINRTQLAKRMGVGPSRVTAMLNGGSNFTLETLIRASRAVGANLE
jgi:predicted transcriptional regulator